MNELSPEDFVARFGFLFEHTPGIVVAVAGKRPFASGAAMHAALMAEVAAMPEADKLALLRAHPQLADKAAIAQGLTKESASEQASADLDKLTEAEFARFQALNSAYSEKFGFPFIVAVRLAGGKTGILSAMETRLNSDRATEMAAALNEVGKIVRLRLEDELDKGLAALISQVRDDLDKLALSHVLTGEGSWIKPREGVLDVLIVGGGQSGLGAAFGLKREKIGNILVVDENPAGLEGPWATYARMVTLRTPKHLTAVDYGVPSLTFRSYWEARCGKGAWDCIDKIPRGDWMDYLRWFRDVLNLPVINDMRVERIEPVEPDLFRVHASGRAWLARKVILATGIQGGGQWHVPPEIANALPKALYAHTSEAIDFNALRGKRIAVIGAGASSFDNANHALIEGVAEAHVFVRRKALPRINPIRHMEAVNLLPRFASLSDADKYAVIAHFFTHAQPPTNDTFARAAAHKGFKLHLGAPILEVAEEDGQAVLTTPQGRHVFDFVIVSTGLVSDPALRPELAEVAGDILRWGEVYQAPEAIRNPLIDAHPYLGGGFALKGRTPGGDKRLHGLFIFNYSALASFGLSAAAISGMKHALPRLTSAVADQLFNDDREALLRDYYAYADEEFTADREVLT
jgi:OHCU decarboxylase